MNGRTTLVRVTRGHIADGAVRSCTRCPVALALREALGDLLTPAIHDTAGRLLTPPCSLDVEADIITVWRPREFWRATTPDAAAAFIDAFDNFGDVGRWPFEFTLTWEIVPDEPDEPDGPEVTP